MHISFTFQHNHRRNPVTCVSAPSGHGFISCRLVVGAALSYKPIDLIKGQRDIYRSSFASMWVWHVFSFMHNARSNRGFVMEPQAEWRSRRIACNCYVHHEPLIQVTPYL